MWSPTRERALLAALAATPEYAQGLRLPDARWREIAATLEEPGWAPDGVHAVKNHWRKVLLSPEGGGGGRVAAIAAMLPPPPPRPESRPSDWTDAGDAEFLATVKLLHGQHGLHMARLEFWKLVELYSPLAPAFDGAAYEHNHGSNNYWQRYSAPGQVRSEGAAAVAAVLPLLPLCCRRRRRGPRVGLAIGPTLAMRSSLPR